MNKEEKNNFEYSTKPISIEGTEKILFQMKNCICQIHKSNGKKGTGFFCKFLFKDKFLNCLVTNNSILK